ncbi:beta-ketoacyl-[acyl-carrier-protein] synthase family protein [Kribbella sp. NPDC023972]|uniref:beta-ketoacyl-[acyl-carrier-protein] synthase family protein n=1 Tax=Kribbella sp. NPDC023972 TaxID=3154795 RepID=UPI0033DB8485
MTAEPRRVVVTGIGVVSSIGIGVDEFTAALRAGRSGARPITLFDVSSTDRRMGCEVDDSVFEVAPGPSRAAGFAVLASLEAARQARLEAPASRGIVAVGTTDGCAYEFEAALAGPSPQVEHPTHSSSMLPEAVADALGLTGEVECLTIGSACAAGNYALTYAFDCLQMGDADYAVIGGADAMARKTFLGFDRLGSIAAEACRPFDLDRDGILTGEGAGMLVLETLEHATGRGAPILVEMRSGALTCDADHAVVPNRQSLRRCMDLALRRADLRPDEISLISAHGTGTRLNDSTETAAVKDVYGANVPPTISIKSMLGHTMGAASAIAACAAVLAITDGFIPPTINFRRPDPDCDVDCVPNQSRPARVTAVQNNSAGFGGNNCVTIFTELAEAR